MAWLHPFCIHCTYNDDDDDQNNNNNNNNNNASSEDALRKNQVTIARVPSFSSDCQ